MTEKDMSSIRKLLDDIIVTVGGDHPNGCRIMSCSHRAMQIMGLTSEYDTDIDRWFPTIYTESPWGDFTEYSRGVAERVEG